MKAGDIPPVYLVAAVIIGGGALWLATRSGASIGRSIGGGAVDLVSGVLSGAWDALPSFGRPEPSDYEGAKAQVQKIINNPDINPWDWAYGL